jgi:DNA-binding IclR family transcriptional regulator
LSGFERYSGILKLFSSSASSWTVAELAVALDKPASSLYRTVRELVADEYLESAAGSYYRLGPAFVEMERVISKTDPLLRSAVPFVNTLALDSPVPCAVVLARRYGSKVMCVADAYTLGAKRAPSYERGKPMPITRGATSLIILAQVRGKALQQLLNNADLTDINERRQFIEKLDKIRRNGICTTRGEVDTGLAGCAVPIRNRPLGIEASLSCVFSETELNAELAANVFARLMSFSTLIEKHMQTVFEELAVEHSDEIRISQTKVQSG